jgi:hypothetical protein
MKHFITALVLSICASTLALGQEPTMLLMGDTPYAAPVDASVTQDDMLTVSAEIFPKEIYLGDIVYLVVYLENRTSGFGVIYPHEVGEYFSRQFSLSSSSCQSDYRWIPEHDSVSHPDGKFLPRTINPGQQYIVQKIALEFPPLEDWNDQFWQAVRQSLAAKNPGEGITCTLHVKHPLAKLPFDHDVLVKARPANETALLERWFDNTPETQFPVADSERKVPYKGRLEPSGKSNIMIGGEEYDPWTFVRFGVRKPSDPNNPTTLEGWRELEASLAPSTMRDEIRFARLQLEYYLAEPGEDAEKAKAELVDWLKSLPEIQRTSMTYSLVSKRYDFFHSPLSDENRDLMRTAYDLLDDRCKEIVCNFESLKYNDHTLTPPPGVKVRTPFEEVIKPAPEDLAHRSKDLPDGFRIWNFSSDSSALVAQFAKLDESNNVVYLKARDGSNFTQYFSALSEEDQEYARAMSRAAAEKPEGE